MKRVAYSLVLAAGLASTSALAADMAVKAPPAPPPPPSPWDVVVTAALMTDYNFRGITQSAHKPSVAAGFEPRYNCNSNFQLYAGISGESIDFPNRAAAEIDFYGGIRPTFDKLALDFGIWYYYYPGGQCFNTRRCAPASAVARQCTAVIPAGRPKLLAAHGNVAKPDASFYECYGKATYTVNDQSLTRHSGLVFAVSRQYRRLWLVLRSAMSRSRRRPPGSQQRTGHVCVGDVGYWELGTSDSFYGGLGLSRAGIPTRAIATGTPASASPTRCSRLTCATTTPT